MEPIDYEKVVADLEAKRATFNTWVDTAIQSMRQVLAAVSGIPQAAANTPVGPAGTPSLAPASVTPDAFFGLSIGDAAIRYLQIVKRQQSTREIADALVDAHYPHTSQNFVNTVNTALYRRSKDEEDVIRIGRNWALAEWYPGRRRSPKGREGVSMLDASAANGEPADAE